MVFGMTLATYTLFHVLLSLVGLSSGFVVLFGLITGRKLENWTSLFLMTTVLTSLTGFGFPVQHLMPSHVLGTLSLIVLGLAIFARYARRVSGAWRKTYVISATIALYFNSFVAVVQTFEKVPAFKALAPTQSEPPFVVAQLAVLALFVTLGSLATIRFRETPIQAARSASA